MAREPVQSIGSHGWEPRPLQVKPPRWSPLGPWVPDDEEAFLRGWGVRTRARPETDSTEVVEGST